MLEVRPRLAVASLWAAGVIGLAGCERKEGSLPVPQNPDAAVRVTPSSSLNLVREAARRIDPSLGQVTEVITPTSPSGVVVHIRMCHVAEDFDFPEPVLKNIEKVQNSIYRILDPFIKDCHVSRMYRDAYDEAEAESHRFLQNIGRQLDEMAIEKNRSPEELLSWLNETLKSPDPEVQKMGKSLAKPYRIHSGLLRLDATYRLAYESKVQLALTEDDKMYREVSRFLHEDPEKMINNSPEWQALREKRENEIIARISKDGLSVAVLALGDMHFLRNNIEKWNSAHPEKSLGLVEIMPDGIKETRELQRQWKEQTP